MKKRRLLSIAMSGLLTILAVTGCGSTNSSTASASGGGSVIKIGSVHPLTGSYAYEAQAIVNAQQLAIDEINAAGGIASMGGAKLELEVGDSQAGADTGASETERLISEGCSIITGTFQSGVTLTCMQKAEQNQVPFLVTVSNNVAMFENGFEYCFRIQPNADVFAHDFIEYITEIKTDDIKTAVLIHEDSLTGTDSGDIIAENMGATGIELLDRITYSASTATLSTEVTKIADLKPDLLITIGYFADTSLLVKELNERGVELKMVCGVANGGISDTKFIEDFGDTVENYLDLNYRFNPNSEKTEELLTSYKEKYGDDMSVHAVWGYESIYVIADALERAGSSDSEALKKALHETNIEDHVLAQAGPITFDEKGENVNAAGVLVQIQNGKHVVVYPREFAEAELIVGE
ncbi:ABC transporter substrate-binding protein [Butyrivibrio sp.]|uniref:ABC transporter substrate-binding protein n=1 Tax=Butyrivibrio sp. TaxID=28121 RepID=UPI0025B977BE|nr:ABC transporter substrate-binding protein [Butyrivibrio sp.]MBQ9302097.1 ABC transporter substrate-binding protein [Butyrivibrio sp.]